MDAGVGTGAGKKAQAAAAAASAAALSASNSALGLSSNAWAIGRTHRGLALSDLYPAAAFRWVRLSSDWELSDYQLRCAALETFILGRSPQAVCVCVRARGVRVRVCVCVRVA